MSDDQKSPAPEPTPTAPPPIEEVQILLGEQRSNYQNFIVGIELAPPDPGGLPAPEALVPTMDAAPPTEAAPQIAEPLSE